MIRRVLFSCSLVWFLAPAVAWAQNYSSGPPASPVADIAPAQSAQSLPGYPPAGYPANGPPALPSAAAQPTYVPPPTYYGPPGVAPNYISTPSYVPAPAYAQGPVMVPAPAQPQYVPAPTPPVASNIDGNITIPEGPRWIFSAEALWLERTDDRGVLLGETVTNPGSGPSFTVDTLYSDDELFPLAPGAKFQLAYRLDNMHALEVVYFGVQNWSVGRTIYGDPIGDSVLAFSPWTQTDALVGGFDNYLGYTYKSSVNNVEVNDRFAGTGGMFWSVAGLWGVRYVNVADHFTLSGADTASDTFENIDIHTNNNLIGPQLGIEFIRDWNRFQLNTELKASLMANFVTERYSNLNSSGVTQGNPPGFFAMNQSNNATGVAGLFEFTLIGRYRLTDHLWLRGGYESYYLAGLAVGPQQLNGFHHGSGIGLDGPSIGLEASW